MAFKPLATTMAAACASKPAPISLLEAPHGMQHHPPDDGHLHNPCAESKQDSHERSHRREGPSPSSDDGVEQATIVIASQNIHTLRQRSRSFTTTVEGQ
jgi:hypothetical protein